MKARNVEEFNRNRRHRSGNIHEEFEEVIRKLLGESGYDDFQVLKRRTKIIVGKMWTHVKLLINNFKNVI